jgi:hypothetical protein
MHASKLASPEPMSSGKTLKMLNLGHASDTSWPGLGKNSPHSAMHAF